ncbi:sulfoxide reductase heme-binding subunit YedZ [Rhodoligotrophos appendicifer]|uniref:protein-methionine-sulfoxide reductase heme-binding subunit MsrQ n=1 Tax=Rhodoligotrophos appendicifer TaxID=987056 RepID=UPI0011872C8B|nr:protein-methionine-sulfoxide reductase heme-binding subunit MsrQ [Rhodoligotrophos appendicifer]
MRLSPRIINWLVYVIGLQPGLWTFYLGVVDQLGADPVKVLEHTLGEWALRFLILTLLITPIRDLIGLNWIRYRRALGLLAFYYAAAHFATYLILDQSLDLAAVGADIVKRPFITVGMAALVILTTLAVTSNGYSIRKLGVNWRRLHRLIYLAAALGAVHFILAVKSWPPEPLVYAGIIAVLLLYRLLPKRRSRRRVVAQPNPRG